VITSPVPASVLTGSTVTFNWTAGSGDTAYWLDAGSSAGGNTYYSSGNLGNVLTTSATGLPTNGSTVYVTLYSYNGTAWLSNAYTYTAYTPGAGAAGQLTTPPPTSTLTGSTVTFDWSAGTGGATGYWLDLGNTAGGNTFYSSGNLGTALTTTASGLPTDGSTVYATLYSLIGGSWTSNAYTYVAAGGAGSAGVMTNPSPNGTTLSGNSVTFTWTAGAGTAWWIDVSAVGAGGNDLDSSGSLAVQSYGVSNLPANGGTIYVTLYSYVGGSWISNAYTYTSGP
jgi:hypothetical protein